MEENFCEKISNTLKAKREELGLSIEELSRRSLVPASIIKALENGNWDALPEPVYVRNFLRMLAKALDLEEPHLLELFDRCEISRGVGPDLERIKVTKKTRSGRFPILSILVAFAVFFFVVSYVVLKKTTLEMKPNLKLYETGFNETSAQPSKEVTYSITLRAVRDRSWYMFVTDGKKKAQGFVEKGRDLIISYSHNCTLKLGKPDAVEIIYGDQKLILPFSKPCTIFVTPKFFKILSK